MTKGIKYAFSYNLRSKDPFWVWLFNGQDRGNITGETRRSYTR